MTLTSKEHSVLASIVSGRYGCLALARAAGAAADAARRGDLEQNKLWSRVVETLRMGMPQTA